MADRGFTPRALGEIAIRCADLDAMAAFYHDVIGLNLVEDGDRPGRIRFFKIADGVAGHITVLALFEDPNPPDTGARSSLHHLALSLPYAEQEAAIAWYEKIRQPYRVQLFPWVGWRGVFTEDPEGNTVELVAYDASLKA